MKKAQVLIVESDGIIAMDIESRLKQLGYGVSAIAGSGEEAIEKVKENEPAIVLMDLMLKGEMEGIEAAEKIRIQSDIPVIFLTVFADKDRLKQAKLTYPFSFILKPFQNKDLEVAIEMALYVAKIDAERKRAQEKLELFRELINQSNDAIYVIDSEFGCFLDVNEKACDSLKYSREEFLNMKVVDIEAVIPDHFSWEAHVNELREKGSMVLEGQHKRKDGSSLPIEMSVKFIKYEKKEYILAVVRDLTDRKLAEEELRESEERYKALFENMGAGVAIYEVRGNAEDFIFKDFNKAAEKIDRQKKEDLLGRSIFETRPGVEEFGLINTFREVWKTGHPKHHPITLYQDHKLQGWFDNFVYRLPNDEIVAIFTNETDRKQAEEALRDSEEQLKTILDSLPAGVLIIAADTHKIVSANPAALQMIGVSEEQVLGSVCHKYICPSAKGECPITDFRQKMDKSERVLLKVDGEKVPILKSVDKMVIKGKEFLVETFIDITERKKLESQLQQSQKMESIGTLAGGIAHDFNNILFPIMGFAEMSLDDAPRNSPLRDKIKEILLGTKRASDLVKQLLAFSRQADQQLKPLKIQLIVKEVLKLMRSSLPSTIEIKQEISNECGLVSADVTQMHQVAMNLVTNAYHAMDDKGGKLEVTLKEVELGVGEFGLPPGRYACLTVADTGIGIERHELDKIFEPYFTTKEKGKGTGLGLSVVHGIVKNFNGYIKVYSEPGEGTAFHVYLPVIKSLSETEEDETFTPVPIGTERILLVDDEEQTVRMEKQMLERLGYQVTERTNSIEALKAFQAIPDKFDLVITDMTMPNMTGVQLSQKLLEIIPDIPIIICTGFSEKIDDEKAKALGIRGFVMKPIIQSELAKKIREVLDQVD